MLKCIGPSSEFAVAEADRDLMEKKIIDLSSMPRLEEELILLCRESGTKHVSTRRSRYA